MLQIEDTSSRLAARLRVEREVRGWSLAELAERAGVSKAMISRVERGEASPTAALLGKLSGALGLTMSTLLARAEATDSGVVRRANQDCWRDPATGYERRAVVAGPGSPCEVTEVSLPPGAVVSMPLESYLFIRQAMWVLDGKLRFHEGDVIHTLEPGDSLVLGEPQNCTFENPGTRSCRYVVVVVRR